MVYSSQVCYHPFCWGHSPKFSGYENETVNGVVTEKYGVYVWDGLLFWWLGYFWVFYSGHKLED